MTESTLTPSRTAAPLPPPRGPLSEAVVTALRHPPGHPVPPAGADGADPFGDDLQAALYICYELHYRGFDGVDADWEWDLGLLAFRAALERVFLGALRAGVPGGDDVAGTLDALLVEDLDARGVSHHLKDEGAWWQMREYFVHRSLYHLKEADPHAWLIPRLEGRAKASLVAVEFDEYGGGRAERVHARLFADLLRGAGLDDGYLAYFDAVPAAALATVNMMSLFGLHRSLRAAMVGHFAAAEITTAPSAHRMAVALERFGAAPECVLFFTEHIEADAVHEQVLRRDVIGDLLDREPGLAADVVFGVQATELLEERLGGHLLASWRAGRSSLRAPLPDGPAAG
ncbi:iron-containing redox enzyme family protein [Actinomadura parmotrematis]|uniref:Iron-containing redox enzyme family protein n=1 Tax=Actinomadura parmotrematis TaxID=2864039 RepID=A0ABS7FVL0_9ACTN|nr:iron-containing redox enzyme family protein [Actinomadura parmotrematis]MBW8483612.1 iron-containing redox enzyme family protein [Actinomadura parmotrematis]